MLRSAFLILYCLLLCALAGAQPSSYNFRKLGISDGLHDGAVKCVAQDKFGYIWIGTVGALNRFNSKKVEVFTYDMDDTTTPYSSQPVCMKSDTRGRFWIGYQKGLIEYIFETGVFRKVTALQNSNIYCLTSVGDSLLYVGTSKGLVRLNTNNDRVFFYSADSLPQHQPIGKSRINDMQFRAPFLYLATNHGVAQLNVATNEVTTIDLPELKDVDVGHIAIDHLGDLWLALTSNASLVCLRADLQHLDFHNDWKNPKEIYTDIDLKDILVDGRNNVWFVSAQEGLLQFVRSNQTIVKHKCNPEIPSGLTSNNYRTLYQDRNGVIWAASDIGAVYFKPEKNFFNTLMPFDTDLWARDRRVARAITIDNKGVIWMGAHDGVSNYDPQTGLYRQWRNQNGKPLQLRSNFVRSMWYAHPWVWIGTSDGVNRFDLTTQKMEFVSERDLPLTFYNTITADRSGNIWFGTNDTSTLYWYSLAEKKYHSIHEHPQLRQYERYAPVSYVYEDRHRRLWISFARKGIVCLDKNTGKSYVYDTKQDPPHRIIGNQVIDIKEDSKGIIWASTMNGVSGIDVAAGTIRNYNRKNGLANNWVSPILIDPNDRVWIGASGGLCMLEADRKTMTTFTLANGLPSVGFPEHAGIIDSNGVAWMATYNGYISYNTHQYKADTSHIAFYVAGYQSADAQPHRLYIGQQSPIIQLKAGDNSLTMEIEALNFLFPAQTRYAYRLVGFDDEWHYTQDGKVVYTNIPGGKYRFEYKAVSGNQQWASVQSKYITVEIGSYFYQTRWFWGLLGVLVFGSLWAYYRSQLRNQKRIYDLQSKTDALQKENALVMFESLKQQLNPHFLFNSLTSLSGLIHSDTRQASRFLEKLGKLYRYVLNSQDNETVTLKEEIQFAETYLHLQHTRFGDGLAFTNEVDTEYYMRRIAPVTLQKLIENAIKHNVIDAESPLTIRICVADDYLVCENNLQRKNFVETSNKKGLSSLQRLYSFISPNPILIEDNTHFFIVKIPLL